MVSVPFKLILKSRQFSDMSRCQTSAVGLDCGSGDLTVLFCNLPNDSIYWYKQMEDIPTITTK